MLPTGLIIFLHIYECITVPLYLRIIYVLTTEKQFKNPFWRIFYLASLIDLSYFLLSLLFYRLPLMPLFQPIFAALPPSRWIGFGMFLAFLLVYQQFLLHLLICFNRLTSIWFPFGHRTFWDNKTRFLLLTSLLLSFGLTFSRLFTVGQFMPLIATDPSKGYTPIPIQFDLYTTHQELITTVLGSVCALLCLLFNAITLVKIVRHKSEHSSNQLQHQLGRSHRIEIGLFLITLWTMFAQNVFNAFELIIYVILNGSMASDYFNQNKEDTFYMLFSQIPWIVDIYTLSQPWAGLLLSSDLRRATFPIVYKLLKKPDIINSHTPLNTMKSS